MTGEPYNNTSPVIVDEEYKSAIQPVVDNQMRTDILGPHFCRVLKDHKPASEDIVALIAKQIDANPELKTAIKSVVKEHNKETKIRFYDRVAGALSAIVLALIIWGIQYLITSTVPPQVIQEKSEVTSNPQPSSNGQRQSGSIPK